MNYCILLTLLVVGLACQPKSKEVRQNHTYLSKQNLEDKRQTKKQKKEGASLKKISDYQDSVANADYVGLWEYLSKFYRFHQPNHIFTYPLRATTYKASQSEYENLDVYHYGLVQGLKIKVITNKVRSVFTPQVDFNSSDQTLLLDSVTHHQIKRVKKKDEYPYFAVFQINGKSFNLSNHLIPDTLAYFKYRERTYLTSAQLNNETMGTTRQYSILHVFDITNRKNIKHFELKGRYQSRDLLYDYNQDGVLDYPIYENYPCKSLQTNLCQEKTAHKTCGRIYLQSLYPEGWKKLNLYGIYFYRDTPENPYIYIKECHKQWVD